MDDDEKPKTYWCPWCCKDGQTIEHIKICSSYKSTGMPDNETGHPYGCGCSECMAEYLSLK